MIGPSLRALAMVDPDLLRHCIDAGAAHRTMSFGSTDGQITRRVELRQPAGPRYPGGFGIMRPVFWGLLAAAAQEAGASIRLTVTVTAIRQEPEGVEVSLSDGSVTRCDLLVGADGLWSKVREMAFGPEPAPSFTGQTAWRVMVPRAPEIDGGIVIYNGPRGRVGWPGSCGAGTSGAGWWWKTRCSLANGISTPATREPTQPVSLTPRSQP